MITLKRYPRRYFHGRRPDEHSRGHYLLLVGDKRLVVTRDNTYINASREWWLKSDMDYEEALGRSIPRFLKRSKSYAVTLWIRDNNLDRAFATRRDAVAAVRRVIDETGLP